MSEVGMEMTPDGFLQSMASSAVQEVAVAGGTLRPGSRVRLRPRGGGDLLDGVLAGRVAIVEGIDEDDTGVAHVAVMLEEDPGRDLGQTRHPAHRFFFSAEELEPLGADEEPVLLRVLVAGIGNVFFGDDGFGVAVARQLAGQALPRGTDVFDFGIRGIDLAYTLTGGGYDAAILVDLMARGGAGGTLYLLDPDAVEGGAVLDSHQMNPVAVLGMARELGPLPPRLLVLGCERAAEPSEEMSMEMSPPVAAAVQPAAEMVVELVKRMAAEGQSPEHLLTPGNS
jgi:hydrogenase maturation protease